MTDITELSQSLKAAAEPISSGYSRNWIVSHDDETCWVGANDDDGNLTPFIEVSIADWSGNKVDNEKLARFIALCRPANILALVEALEKAQASATQQGNIACALLDEVTQLRRHADDKAPELRAQLIEADGELEALRQRIAELESRTVTVKLPEVRITVAESRRRNMTWRELGAYNEGADVAAERIGKALTAAGIKWEAE